MLSDGRFLRKIEPNSIPLLLRSYFQSSHRLPHVLVLTGLAFYWIHNIPLYSAQESVLYIVQVIEGLGLVEWASDSSFPGNSSDFIAHSLKECELSAILSLVVSSFSEDCRGTEAHVPVFKFAQSLNTSMTIFSSQLFLALAESVSVNVVLNKRCNLFPVLCSTTHEASLSLGWKLGVKRLATRSVTGWCVGIDWGMMTRPESLTY